MHIIELRAVCKPCRVVSLPEVGTIDIELCSDGWRVHHMDYHGDHGSLIDSGLPSRPAAIHAALTYAIATLAAAGGRGAA
jgi:hypothetical protein